ncbi:hypothetical protein [Tsuneonella sp. HG222]
MMFAFGDDVWPGVAKLVEECGEVQQVAGKLMMRHGDRCHWSGDLRQMMLEEVADLRAAALFVTAACFTPDEQREIERRIVLKSQLFHGWHRNPDDDPPLPVNHRTVLEGVSK